MSRSWAIFVALLVAGLLLYLLAPVLTPFLIAAILAYMTAPLVERLERWHLPRLVAVVVIFAVGILAVLALPLIVAPMLERQVSVLLGKLPAYIDWLQATGFPWLQRNLGLEEYTLDLEGLKRAFEQQAIGAGTWQKLGGVMAGVAAAVSRSGAALIGWTLSTLVVFVVTFYLLRDWKDVLKAAKGLLPARSAPKITQIATECDEVLGGFLRGQLTVMASLTLVYAVGLWMVGLELALLIAVLSGLVSFVPYLGVIVGIVVAGVAAVVQFHDLSHLALVFVVFGVGQVLEGFVLTPLLVGDRLGLHPVAVIFSVMAGGQLFGFFGVLLALPLAAVVVVLFRHAREAYSSGSVRAGVSERS